jgi:hypothetical protein
MLGAVPVYAEGAVNPKDKPKTVMRTVHIPGTDELKAKINEMNDIIDKTRKKVLEMDEEDKKFYESHPEEKKVTSILPDALAIDGNKSNDGAFDRSAFYAKRRTLKNNLVSYEWDKATTEAQLNELQKIPGAHTKSFDKHIISPVMPVIGRAFNLTDIIPPRDQLTVINEKIDNIDSYIGLMNHHLKDAKKHLSITEREGRGDRFSEKLKHDLKRTIARIQSSIKNNLVELHNSKEQRREIRASTPKPLRPGPKAVANDIARMTLMLKSIDRSIKDAQKKSKLPVDERDDYDKTLTKADFDEMIRYQTVRANVIKNDLSELQKKISVPAKKINKSTLSDASNTLSLVNNELESDFGKKEVNESKPIIFESNKDYQDKAESFLKKMNRKVKKYSPPEGTMKT